MSGSRFLSYAVVVVVFGVVISKFGTNIIFITFAFGAALNVYIASRIKTDTPVAALKLKTLKSAGYYQIIIMSHFYCFPRSCTFLPRPYSYSCDYIRLRIRQQQPYRNLHHDSRFIRNTRFSVWQQVHGQSQNRLNSSCSRRQHIRA